MTIPIYSDEIQKGNIPEILFWVGCAGSFDARAQKITKAFAMILEKAKINYAILGSEEMCTGDPARRAGNEFLFQMLSFQNIQLLNGYGIKKIVTACPHCFNSLKNEYPVLGGNFEVMHHTTFINKLVEEGKIKFKKENDLEGKQISYHDSCYLGRHNDIYGAPRKLLEALNTELVEMKSCKKNGLCCGAGGAQMFKEEEKGIDRINSIRVKEAIETKSKIIGTACPFCNTMLTDGVKLHTKYDDIQVLDIAELIIQSME